MTTTLSDAPHTARSQPTLARRRALTGIALIGLGVILLFSVDQIVASIYAAANFNGHPMNGAFQLYNPLRRIAAGQLPGADFPFFHGVGVPWLHYPIFALLGSGLFASELARNLISPFLFLGSSTVFFLAFFRSWKAAAIATAVFISAAPLVTEIVEHGNAMLGVRSTVPVLVAAALLWQPKRSWMWFGARIDASMIAATALLGLSFSLGTEQGIAAIGAYVIVRLIVLWRTTNRLRAITQTAIEGLAVAVSLLLWLSIFTGGHPLEALRFTLVEVPQDQTWYFGVPPNPYLNLSTFVELMFRGLPLAILIASAFMAGLVILLARKRLLSSREKATFLFMALAGLIACGSFIGYFWPQNQMSPLGRLVGLVLVAVMLRLAINQFSSAPRLSLRSVPLAAIVALVSLVALIVGSANAVTRMQATPVRTSIAKAIEATHQPDSFVLLYNWADSLYEIAPRIEGHSFWSTWGGIYEANAGVLHPSQGGEDYIIHALGDERRDAYTAQFLRDKPEFVITVNPQLTGFEGWVWAPHSEIYENILTNYDLVVAGSPHFLWERRSEPWPQTSSTVDADLAEDGSFWVEGSDADETEVLEVTVEYTASANLPFLDRMPRYFLTAEDSGMLIPISLPSQRTSFTFFVPLIAGQDKSHVIPSVEGFISTASLEIHSAQYRLLDIPPQNEELFTTFYCPSNYLRPDSTANCE